MGRDYSSVGVDIVARLHDRYDLPGLIRAHPDKYAAVSIHGGRYQEWERPSVFLHEFVEDDVDFGDLTVDRIDIDWTEDDFRALCLVCPEADLTGQFVPREVRDRMPGPHDVPLPIEEA